MLKSASRPFVTVADERTDLASADRTVLGLVEKAMELEDMKILRAAASAAVKSPTVMVRSETVDAIGWFGVKAMDELLPFMADEDEDVAQSAIDYWTTALGEIEDERRKCELVESVMMVLKRKDSLESLASEFNDCDDVLAMQSVVRLICGENPISAKVAREHYEFMTGDAFTTVQAAEDWMAENREDDEEE